LNNYKVRAQIDKWLQDRAVAKKLVKLTKADAQAAKEEHANWQQALAVLQEVAAGLQQHAHQRISRLVSECLRTVFDEPYTFRIEFTATRGRTHAHLLFERDGATVDPLSASGGGVVDVAAFALRLSALMLTQPPARKLLVLDEPFRFVSADYRPRCRVMLESLASELDVQIIMVTHFDDLQCGTVIQL